MHQFDLNGIDSVMSSSTTIPFNYNISDQEHINMYEETITDQYIYLNNLGDNLLSNLDEQSKTVIFKNMLEYINNHYTSIVDNDNLLTSNLMLIGEYNYLFFCVDCPTMILPNYLNQIECYSNKEFRSIMKTKFKNESYLIKNSLILCIKSILDQFVKLSTLDSKIKDNDSYQNLIKKYSYYIDLIDFGEFDNFIENYLVKLFDKNFNDILWRSN